MLITLKHKKENEKFVKKSLWWKTLIYWIDICDILKVHIGIAIMRQFQCVPTTYVTENKETYLKYTLIKNHFH